MESDKLAGLVDFGASHGFDSFLVVRHGRIVTEAYYAPFSAGLRHRLNSVTKSVIGSLIAIALKDGLLKSTDQRMVDFFPGRTITNLDDNKKAITLQNLLDMNSGLAWREPFDQPPESFLAMEASPDWQQFILDRPMDGPPGRMFHYNSGNTHLLSAILSKVTGMSALDYATEKLFKPLGIDDVLWRHDPQGVSGGAAGLYLRPRDMAKLGYLYLQNGTWEGRQIVPVPWIERVRHAQLDVNASWDRNLRYANAFWANPSRDIYMAVGYHQQLIVVMPALDLVAVMTASSRFADPDGAPLPPRFSFNALIDQLVRAAASTTALPGDAAGLAALEGRIRDAAAEKPTPVGEASELAKTISGKRYRFPENGLHLRSVSLDLTDPEPAYDYEQAGSTAGAAPRHYGGPIGLDGTWRVGGKREFGPSAAKGTWLPGGTAFVLDVQTPGNDDLARVTLTFSGKNVEVHIESADGYVARLRGEAED